MQKRKAIPILTVPFVAAALLLSAGPATAATSSAKPLTTVGDGYVVANPAAGVKIDSSTTFYPTGPLDSGTVVVIPNADGSLPGGLTTTKLKALFAATKAQGPAQAEALGFSVANDSGIVSPATSGPKATSAAVTPFASSSHAYGAASATEWSRPYTGGNIIGTTASTKVIYSFSVNAGSSQINVGLGRGYYTGYNGSVFGTYSKYYNLGSADSNTAGRFAVPWGNTIGTTSFEAKCARYIPCGGYFSP